MKRATLLLTLSLLLLGADLTWAQSGKIAGRVVDASSDDPLAGVNISIVGTTRGAVTDSDGYYSILNVDPGVHDVRASFIGFTPQVVEDIRVNIDLTTTVDFALQEEAVGLDEIVVAADVPVVQPDVSANVANIDATEIENLPVAGIDEVINLQAGIEPGMRVRGSDLSEVAFVVDGMSFANPRDNTPYTGISYTAIDEVQVQTGGFNAEYGNVRAGLINVVTKAPSRNNYNADFLVRYQPPRQKYFGMSPIDLNAYWMRPYFDPEVAFIGTESEETPWDPWMQSQYPRFDGWNAVAQQTIDDEDPTNDLTPQQAQEIMAFRYSSYDDIDVPDYDVDASISGPVPGVSRMLGDLRFLGSYRQSQTAYIVPQERDAYQDRFGQLKLISDVAPGVRIQLTGMLVRQSGHTTTHHGGPAIDQGEMPQYPWDSNRSSIMVNRIASANDLDNHRVLFTNQLWSLMDIEQSLLGLELTHTLSPRTFYTVRLQRSGITYDTRAGRPRDPTVIKVIGPAELDESPLGVRNLNSPWHISPLRLDGRMSQAGDSSSIRRWTARFDLTSQLNRFSQMKAGLQYFYNGYDVQHGLFNPVFGDINYSWNRQPAQGAAYVQNKLEFKGLVANVGLRLDYFNPNGEWYAHELFERTFDPQYGYDELDTVPEEALDAQLTLSPRLGVSFPVTESSKFYFNYGHFRQMLNPDDIFLIQYDYTGAVQTIGNPEHPMPKTVAYELGYEQGVAEQYLIRVSGYYKALDKQPRSVRYISIDERVNYTISRPFNYADIRGIEFTLQKNRGQWVRGFVNYTYLARKGGNFGFDQYYEHLVRQDRYEQETRVHYQSKPVPEPFARFNLELLTPPDWGPELAGMPFLADWRLNLLGEWRAGQVFTWNGGTEIPGLRNNVRWSDYYNLDLRLSKNFDTGVGAAQLFIDASNVLNLRHLNRVSGFQGPMDYENYMRSLRLPSDAFEDADEPPYAYIPGDDRPGDVRADGVEFVPIVIVGSVDTDVTTPYERPLYYEQTSRRYMTYRDGAWREADSDRVDQVLEDKAYIDMPNLQYFRYLNPRNVIFGLRLRF